MRTAPLVRSTARLGGLGAIVMLTACVSNYPAGHLHAVSRAQNPVSLDLELHHGAYAVEPAQTSFYLSDRTLEELLQSDLDEAQIIHAQLLWIPKPGSTPVDPTATNVTLRLALLVDGELGIYGGAGFAWPSGRIGEGVVELELVGSTLTLLHATEHFRDLLSPVLVIGTIRAPFDPITTLRTRQATSQLVTDKLGRTQWLWLDPGNDLFALAAPSARSTTDSP